MRLPVIAGNWKMNKTVLQGKEFIKNIKDEIKGTDVEVMIFAPYTLLASLKEVAKDTNIIIGAQNIHFEDSGAFTGEISADMLKDIGIEYVLVGHSERRQYFNETDDTVNKKLHKAIEKKIKVILCVGEGLEEREKNIEKEIVKNQIAKAFEGIKPENMNKIIIAYEPIWAIGTGKTASKEDANEMIAYIRNLIKEIYGDGISEEIRILYGGSVKPQNIEELMEQEDIDGGLIGGASLKEDQFVQLVNF